MTPEAESVETHRYPTDADAVDYPRRPCWARTDVCSDWEPLRLLAVEREPPIGYRPCYVVMDADGYVVKHTRCVIEIGKHETCSRPPTSWN